jgi:hypothetical protein
MGRSKVNSGPARADTRSWAHSSSSVFSARRVRHWPSSGQAAPSRSQAHAAAMLECSASTR